MLKKLLFLSFLILSLSLPSSAVTLAVIQTAATSGGFGYGYGNSTWDDMTDLLQTAFGAHNISVLSSAFGLGAYDRVWLDQRWTLGSLTVAELAELSAFAATGRRIVMIGENSSFTDWNNQILGIVDGSYLGVDTDNELLSTVLAHQLTSGVTSVLVSTDGVATGGTALFNQNVATLWGGGGNVLTWLSVNMQDDFSTPLADNRRFASNVATWLTGESGQVVPEPSTYILFGAGLAGIAILHRLMR